MEDAGRWRAGGSACLLAVSWAALAAGQPPQGPVDSAPTVSIPALPEALRAQPPAEPAVEPFVGPIAVDLDQEAAGQELLPAQGADREAGAPGGEEFGGPGGAAAEAPPPAAPGAADAAAAGAGAGAPGVAGAGEDAVPAAASEAARPDAPVSDLGPPVVGGESDLSLARRAAALLGGILDPAAERRLVPIGGGAADLAQSLARAVFAAPVAGSIPYVVQAQVHHDVTLIFPVEWRLVQVFVGDPARWAVTHSGPIVVLKPGEAGARTNLTAVLATGEVLQMDLEEVTGLVGARRIGRVYVGPEQWLVDRIFSMLPAEVRRRVVDSPATVAQLLADPVAVVGLYGGTGAVPNPLGESRVVEAEPPAPSGSIPGAGGAGAAAPRPRRAGAFPPPAPRRPAAQSGFAEPAAGRSGAGDGVYVSGTDVAALEGRLRQAQGRVETARRGAGDRIAAAQLGLEADLEALREEYPLRTQFSYVLDPPLPPYTEPLWHFGVWHDGDRTYWRMLAPDPLFRDAESGEPLAAERLDDFLYRFDRVVEHGVVLVRLSNDPQVRELYFRRRRELEGP